MTQLPPGMEAYEAEVRRRVEAANSSPESDHAPSNGPAYPTPPMSSFASARAGSTPRRRGIPPAAVWALAVVTLAIMGLVGYVVASSAQQGGSGSPRDVEVAMSKGPPFAAKLTTSQMYDAYLAMWHDGSIYTIIPDNDEGRDYFKAFMYSVVDQKAANSISGRKDSKPDTELAAREGHFLALEDLELTVDITFDDGTNFTHDGLPPTSS